MKTIDKLKELPKGYGIVLVAPTIDCMMCGVADARISKKKEIKLTYEDGTVETARASDQILETDEDDHSLFTWVSHVQSFREVQE